ncbi:MAG: phosphoadenosine phosphosulfate reductase family protein [Ruminococcaceae bacterium]|nr:phosphoadenosine phosphosulfate reductase family protein [Oscillospiraceae bacterium]
MSKPDIHVVSLSGGKDSTAMLLKMLELKMPVDIILFCDTGLEFPQMYEHLDKLERFIGKKITRIKAEHSFEYYFSEHKIKRKRSDTFIEKYGESPNGYGWAGPRMRWCTSKLKDQPQERFLRGLREKYNVIEYVGIAADEQYRLTRKNNQKANCIHPLADWQMTESDCLEYCYSKGFDWGGLYKIFHRVSCWCCPLQSIEELRKLHDNFPELWEKLRYWDSITWRKYRADYSVLDLEKRFAFEKECLAQGIPINNKAFFAALKERMANE